jgi:hypothetical protein
MRFSRMEVVDVRLRIPILVDSGSAHRRTGAAGSVGVCFAIGACSCAILGRVYPDAARRTRVPGWLRRGIGAGRLG